MLFMEKTGKTGLRKATGPRNRRLDLWIPFWRAAECFAGVNTDAPRSLFLEYSMYVC